MSKWYWGNIRNKDIESVYLQDIKEKYRKIHSNKGLTPLCQRKPSVNQSILNIYWGENTDGVYFFNLFEEEYEPIS